MSVNKILIESIKTISKISPRKLIGPYGENTLRTTGIYWKI